MMNTSFNLKMKKNKNTDKLLRLWSLILTLVIQMNVFTCEDLSSMCTKATTVDCIDGYKPEGNELVCATNNNSYVNLCFFVKAKCLTPEVAILHFGPCPATPQPDPYPSQNNQSLLTTILRTTNTPTITSTVSLLDEFEILRKVFCSTIINCGDEHKPICGSDRRIYKNDCEFAKAGCNRTEALEVMHEDHCAPIIIG